MPDFVPDDMDEYIERSRRVEDIIDVADDTEVDRAFEAMTEAAKEAAEALVATGKLDPAEAVTGVSGVIAGTLAQWYHERAMLDEE